MPNGAGSDAELPATGNPFYAKGRRVQMHFPRAGAPRGFRVDNRATYMFIYQRGFRILICETAGAPSGADSAVKTSRNARKGMGVSGWQGE